MTSDAEIAGQKALDSQREETVKLNGKGSRLDELEARLTVVEEALSAAPPSRKAYMRKYMKERRAK